LEPEPYPLDALPESIRAAVEEVQGFVQAPMSLVACSALAAVSLVSQPHYDIQRAEKLAGPTGLFLLTIADSGERKSSCDGFFTKAIHDYERQQAEVALPLLKDYRANKRSWESKCKGLEDSIRAAARGSEDTTTLEQSLRALVNEEPQEPRVPRLLYADATPESLKFNLAFKWPSGGVVSSEGGVVLGSHAMGSESVMRNLSIYNLGWDGTDIQTERRTSESFTVRGARLTMFLQVQEPTLRSFMTGAGDLARGSGFLARCLVAWPESTQGARAFKEAPPSWPNQSDFNRRLEAILAQPVPINADGSLSPGMLTFSPKAKAQWVSFYDRIERELGSGGRFHDIRDVASKIADNAARLAGLFHVFSGAIGSAVGVEHLEAGCRVAEWHLGEARRFFGEMALPAPVADAARLDAWLVSTCQRKGVDHIPNSDIQHSGPSRLRESAAIDKAMAVLAELDRARQCREGRRRFIEVNPALLSLTKTSSWRPEAEILAVPAVPEPSDPEDPKNRRNRNIINRSPQEPESQFLPLPAVTGETYVEEM
jgi:putative DNA primase/helicase